MPEPEPETPRDHPEDEADHENEGAVLREYRRVMYSFTFIGIEFGVAVALGYFGGSWLDKQWDTAPWMMLVGVALGLTAAGKDFARLIRKAQKAGKPPTNDEDRPDTAEGTEPQRHADRGDD